MTDPARRLALALEDMLRLADMGFEQAMAEPEENGCYVAYTKAREALTAYRTSDEGREDQERDKAPSQGFQGLAGTDEN